MKRLGDTRNVIPYRPDHGTSNLTSQAQYEPTYTKFITICGSSITWPWCSSKPGETALKLSLHITTKVELKIKNIKRATLHGLSTMVEFIMSKGSLRCKTTATEAFAEREKGGQRELVIRFNVSGKGIPVQHNAGIFALCRDLEMLGENLSNVAVERRTKDWVSTEVFKWMVAKDKESDSSIKKIIRAYWAKMSKDRNGLTYEGVRKAERGF